MERYNILKFTNEYHIFPDDQVPIGSEYQSVNSVDSDYLLDILDLARSYDLTNWEEEESNNHIEVFDKEFPNISNWKFSTRGYTIYYSNLVDVDWLYKIVPC